MEAPPLPRTAEDLAEWSVYADHLMTLGDPLGERIATELSLCGPRQEIGMLAFHDRTARFCPTAGRTTFTSWCLGFARELELRPKTRPMADAISDDQHVDDGTLARARDFLRTRAGSRLEELQLPAPHRDHRHYRRLFAALPPSCRRVTLTHEQPASEGVELVLSSLPSTVREVELATRRSAGVAARFVTDQFDTIVVYRATLPDLDELRPALAASSTVRVRISQIHGPLEPRFELGGPDDAAIVALDPRPGRYVLGRPPKLVPMEARFAWTLPPDRISGARRGVVWVTHAISRDGDLKAICLDPDPTVEYPRMTLARRSGAWTAKCGEPMTIDDHAIPAQTMVPIRDGARFTIDGRNGLFLAHDLTAQARAALA